MTYLKTKDTLYKIMKKLDTHAGDLKM